LFIRESLVLIYTVLTQSVPFNVNGLVVLHHVQFVFGFAHVAYAICSHHTHKSTGQVIFNVTDVVFVYVALLLIVNRVDHVQGELYIPATKTSVTVVFVLDINVDQKYHVHKICHTI
jgi:hypothetical protein